MIRTIDELVQPTNPIAQPGSKLAAGLGLGGGGITGED
jgi:hypothetical protein